jgi:DNA/RNA endonuclease YhcR with UshA esterase domain
VTGRIKKYEGRAEIILEKPSQIKIKSQGITTSIDKDAHQAYDMSIKDRR